MRSSEHLTGLPALTAKTWRQVATGTALVRFMTQVVMLLAAYGGCGFFEHPQWPAWLASRQPPSVWVTKAMRRLKALGCVSIASFDQCVLGVDFRKPTTILLLRLKSFRDAIMRLGSHGRCNHPGHTALKGRQSDGTYQTAKAKIYPPLLNQMLGRSVVDFIVQYLEKKSGDEIPESMAEYCQDCYAESHIVQPDFHA